MSKKEESKTYKKSKRIINIVFTIIIIIIIMVSIDIVSVYKYEKGPYFAINMKNYKDGSKAYYGIGYKVIKYNQAQGRRDMEIGLWNLKYNTNPITIQDIDLAIELNEDEVTTYNKYYKKFVRVISKLKSIDEKKNTITIGYTDEDGKYNLDIICKMIPEQTNIASFEKDKEITIIGTIKDYKGSTKKENKRLYIKNCIAEQ